MQEKSDYKNMYLKGMVYKCIIQNDNIFLSQETYFVVSSLIVEQGEVKTVEEKMKGGLMRAEDRRCEKEERMKIEIRGNLMWTRTRPRRIEKEEENRT